MNAELVGTTVLRIPYVAGTLHIDKFRLASPVHQTSTAFEDSFTGAALDGTHWNVAHYGGAASHQDLAEYVPEAVSTGPNGLTITATNQPATDPKTGTTYQYTAGRIQSKEAFTFGRFEWTARLPRGTGLWPALWLRTPPGGPFNGEIDAVEAWGSNPNVVQSTLHPWVNGLEDRFFCVRLSAVGTPPTARGGCAAAGPLNLSSDFASAYHTFAVDWVPDHITWSVDGMPYFTETREIPQEAMIIVINLNVSSRGNSMPDWSGARALSVRSVKYTPFASGRPNVATESQ